ncbi:M48 family metalloprotease [Nocardioides sp. W7]|uniref:M48 family metalloprotease n=1 Tax=Nocardioides sp. W7 TaxID=2931390 RepID=UPI001FD28FE6|nr:M48 family metalloprotease [Nocardioides sp. W7]
MRPLPYHRSVAEILEREHPVSFRALAASTRPGGPELDQSLLRSTYRLEPQAHPDVHQAVGRAADALGVAVPTEVYADERGGAANAELVFVPERAILVFTGSTLELLDPDELCAVAAHELAHHLLWTLEDGRYLAASRLLDTAETDARTPSEYLETARRYRLATELYADRAALDATEDLVPVVGGLLKVATGLKQADPAAYLRQAAEVDLTTPSAGSTHPETVLRAWALQRWAEDPASADDLVVEAFAPALDLDSLDLPGQDRLLVLTRDLVAGWLTLTAEPATPATEPAAEVLELAEQYGVAAAAYPRTPGSLLPDRLPPETRRYLASVLADLATADPEAGHDTLARTLVLARGAGLGPDFHQMLGTDLGLADGDRQRVAQRADALAGGE